MNTIKIEEKIKNKKYDICIYHNKSLNGIVSFWCIKKFGLNEDIIGLPIQKTILNEDLLIGKKIIILDIFDKKMIDDVLEFCTDVLVIDNHKEIYDLSTELVKKNEPSFDLIYYKNKNICQILWNILSEEKTPTFIKFIEQYNLNKKWGKKPHLFHLGFKSIFDKKTYKSIDILFNSIIKKTHLIEKILNNGEKKLVDIKKLYDKLDESYGQNIDTFKFNEKIYKIRICKYFFIDKECKDDMSDMSDNDFSFYICEKYDNIDFSIIWSEQSHKIIIRSKDDIDLKNIIKKWNINKKNITKDDNKKLYKISNINIRDLNLLTLSDPPLEVSCQPDNIRTDGLDTSRDTDCKNEVKVLINKLKLSNIRYKFWYKFGIFSVIVLGTTYFLTKKKIN